MSYNLPINVDEHLSLVPEEIKETVSLAIKAGQEKVKTLYTTGYTPDWPEKLASISFKYNGQRFDINYWLFGIKDTDQAMIYKLKESACKILKDKGLEPSINGFLD